jgi:hypothetical protein
MLKQEKPVVQTPVAIEKPKEKVKTKPKKKHGK